MSEAKYQITWKQPKAQPSVPPRVQMTRQLWAKGDAKRDEGLTTPEDVERFDSLSYGPDEVWNRLDVYRPKAQQGSLPVIVSIHGGGYFYGTKEVYQFYCMSLAQRGFAVINFNYRLAPENKYPAPLLDTNLVMEWMTASAGTYGFDVENVFLVGDSAGAQLASQYALICTNPAYASLMSITPPSFRLRAIGLNCGMYDMESLVLKPRVKGIFRDYFGTDPSRFGQQLKVLDYINSDYPPTYLLSAPNDVLCAHLMPMAALLTRQGVENRWKLYGTPQQKEVAHVFHCNLRLPEAEQANDDETEFFRSHIAAKAD